MVANAHARGVVERELRDLARRLLRESMSLYGFVQARGLKMLAVTTILENVNLVSHETREPIFDQQIGYILQEQYDDFSRLTDPDDWESAPMTAQGPLSAAPTA